MKKIFLVHKWETTDGSHHLHVWDETEDPQTEYFSMWYEALDAAYLVAEKLELDYFQIDHPDFPHKFLKVMKFDDLVENCVGGIKNESRNV